MLRSVLIGFLLVCALPAEVLAIDLTGTWRWTKFACKELAADGTVTKLSGKLTDPRFAFEVSQEENGLMRLRFASDEPGVEFVPYVGAAYASGKNLSTGAQGVLVACPFACEIYTESWRIEIGKTFAANSKGVTGAMVVQTSAAGDGGSLGIPGGFKFQSCLNTFERISTDDPVVPGCGDPG